MSDARADILARIRDGLKRGPLDEERTDMLETLLASHVRSLVPDRAKTLDQGARIALFAAMAEEVDTTIDRVASMDEAPEAITRYLAQRNLPARVMVTPDPKLARLPWDRTTLEIGRGVAQDGDAVGVSACFAAVAETGTLMLVSGPASPTRNNFLPDTHIVVLGADEVVGFYEEAWDRLREAGAMPRTVNFITGPSRTGDIAQKLELGAHGPLRLHIVLVEHGAQARP
ncbi:MAG TPA: lactate utilization protein [Stellaceae bacterium]|nr:lactate utilization protein [Stellaceae bacterium]